MTATRLHQLAKSPEAFDTQLAALYLHLANAQHNRQVAEDNVHKVAGDRKGYEGKRLVWRRTYAEVATTAKAEGHKDVLSAVAKAIQEVAKIQVRIQDMDEVYRAHRWQRYILCLSNNGHVHNEVGCSTLYFDTPVEWRPDLSGLDFDGAVAILGPVLCSVCYPSAPVEHKRSNLTEQARQRTQGERDAAKAERAAKLAAKNLTEAETEFMGRVGVFNDRATTVAKLKEIIRKAVEQAVEVEFWTTHTPEGWDAEHLANRRRNGADDLVKLEADADRAQFILIEREHTQEDHGATAEEIAKIRATKLKSARKEWGLLARSRNRTHQSARNSMRTHQRTEAMMAGWQIKDLSGGEYVVTGPDGTEYQVTAHYENSQSPIPEDAVHIDQITSNGVMLHDGRRVLVAHDAAITTLVEDAVLTAEGW